MEKWIPQIVAGLIVLSVLYELWTGVARVRGFGRYERRDRPGMYWLAMVGKLLLAAVAVGVGQMIRGAR